MKNSILFVGENYPKWAEELEKSFNLRKEPNTLKAYMSIFESVPDAIIYNVSDLFYDGFYMYSLLNKKDSTKKIPFILTGKELPENIDFKNAVKADADFEKNAEDNINKIISDKKLSDEDKASIKKDEPNTNDIQDYTKCILEELLLASAITEEFKTLIDSMNFENVLVENIFKIINKYLDYDVAGIFINDSDESSRNVLSLSVPHNNVTVETTNAIRDEFFDEMEKYKRVNEIQCNLTVGNVAEKSDITARDFKFAKIIPYKYDDKLTGGIFFCSTKQPDVWQNMFFEVIKREMDAVLKLKYLFNEQAKNAFKDPMTGLYTRQLFDSNLENEFFRARRYVFNFSLAMLDVDYLSKINEEYGKDFGDYVLTELSNVLKNVFRRTDLIYRYGGEEIIIYLPSTPITKALIPIERLRDKIANHKFEKDGKSAKVTVSIGLCANYSKFTEPIQLLDGVANAMMRAKERGRNKVDIFE